MAQLGLFVLLLSACASGPEPSSQRSGASGGDAERSAGKVVPELAKTMYEKAVAAMAAGDELDAQLRFQEFLLRYSEYPGAHINLAIIYAKNGNDQAAQGSITDALIIDPEHPAALNQLGMLLRRQGRFAEAQAAYERAISADPEYALAHYNLGVLNELYLQRIDLALLHFEYYQSLGGSEAMVAKWIVDLRRRVKANQRTANVTE